VKRQDGYSLIEIVLAVAILAIVMVPLVGVMIRGYSVGVDIGDQIQAVFYAQEAMESAYNVLSHQWEEVSVGEYHPDLGSGVWVLLTGSEEIGDFTRVITISNALRDADGNLSDSGDEDKKTKRVEVSVHWSDLGVTHEKEIVSYYSEVGVVEE